MIWSVAYALVEVFIKCAQLCGGAMLVCIETEDLIKKRSLKKIFFPFKGIKKKIFFLKNAKKIKKKINVYFI